MPKERKESNAKMRINYLFDLIENAKDTALKKNAIKMIEKIRKRHNVRLTSAQKSIYCKFCFNPYVKPRIRIKKIVKNKKRVVQKVVICDICGKERRFTIKN